MLFSPSRTLSATRRFHGWILSPPETSLFTSTPSCKRNSYPVLHYSLNPGGILFLGTAESIGEFVDLFNVLDRKWKIYQRREKPGEVRPAIGTLQLIEGAIAPALAEVTGAAKATRHHLAERALLEILPPAVLIDKSIILCTYMVRRVNTCNSRKGNQALAFWTWPGKV